MEHLLRQNKSVGLPSTAAVYLNSLQQQQQSSTVFWLWSYWHGMPHILVNRAFDVKGQPRIIRRKEKKNSCTEIRLKPLNSHRQHALHVQRAQKSGVKLFIFDEFLLFSHSPRTQFFCCSLLNPFVSFAFVWRQLKYAFIQCARPHSSTEPYKHTYRMQHKFLFVTLVVAFFFPPLFAHCTCKIHANEGSVDYCLSFVCVCVCHFFFGRFI